MTDTPADEPRSRPARRLLRRWIYPAAVIITIAGVIWWIEARDNGGSVSSTGERYGPAEMPTALTFEGVNISAAEGDMAPDFLLQNMEGDEVRLTDFRGQPVVLNFWATWCLPCRKEMPQFVHAYDDYSEEGLVIIAVNQQESESIIRPFVEDYGVEFPMLIDRDGEVGDEFHILGMPETFFIDRNGILREHFIGQFQSEDRGKNVQGAIDQSELQSKIEQILTPAESGDGSG
jgi:peroxiredoxin